MDKTKQIIYEIHLYKGKLECMIKMLIWVTSWVIGILVARLENSNIGGSYFIFTLALLMEFASQIKLKREFLARLFHTIFCFIIGAILILSVVFIFSSTKTIENIMFVLSIAIMCYMVLDMALLWIFEKEEEDEKDDAPSEDQIYKEMIDKFNKNLAGGSLGILNTKR